jgi:hypothetical protein
MHWDTLCADAAQMSCAVCTGAPPNNVCTNPEPVLLPGLAEVPSWPFDNTGATTTGPPEPCGGFMGDVAGNSDSDLWFEFVAPCAQTYTVSVSPLGGGPESFLAVYDGTCPQFGGPIIGGDMGLPGLPAEADIKTVVGGSYS